MKNLILALLCSSTAFTQIYDDFNDGNFTQNPQWFGAINHYEIDSNFWLHLDAPSENSSSALYLKSSILENAQWEIQIKLDFNPSGANYLDWYFMANDSNLVLASEAYFVRVGDSQDEISLYRQKNGVRTKIIDGIDGSVSQSEVSIELRIERDMGGYFSLSHKVLNSDDWFIEGTIYDNQCHQAKFSGILCNYTSTRSDKFYFDNYKITGEPLIDSIAPILINSEIITSNSILLDFEADDFENIHANHFVLNNSQAALDSIIQNKDTILLHYNQLLPTNTNFSLLISGLLDTAGNIMNDTTLYFYQQEHQMFDVVINEIMMDPEPNVQLAEAEYIECFNRANYPLNLKGWHLKINEKEYTIDSVTIMPQSYLLLLKPSDSIAFTNSHQTIINYSSLPNNTGFIGLYDSLKNLVHEVEYYSSWHGNENKNNGGWSLEMIDPEAYCVRDENWSSSVNIIGGSPGLQNSIYTVLESDSLTLEKVQILDEKSIALIWSENIYDEQLLNIQNYIMSDNLVIDTIVHALNKTQISLATTLTENHLFNIKIKAINNCKNKRSTANANFCKGLWPKQESVYINEILFNPKSDGYDYVELYNASDTYIELSDLLIGNYDSLFNQISNPEIITENYTYFAPYSYITLCENSNWVKFNYEPRGDSTYIEVSNLPSFPDKEGTVAIASRSLEILDYFIYSEDMHFELLDSKEAVALERLSVNHSLWHSAPSTSHFGSPSWPNSQQLSTKIPRTILAVEPEIISPNLDGDKDFTQISIQSKSASMAKLSIYNQQGLMVWESLEYDYINTGINWLWNGIDLNQNPLPMGLYMILVELINEDGKKDLLKHPIVIYRK